MKNAIITVATAVTGFAVGALVGCARTFCTYPRLRTNTLVYFPLQVTGGSFRESLEDNSDSATSCSCNNDSSNEYANI